MNKIKKTLIAIVLGFLFICANQGSATLDRFNEFLVVGPPEAKLMGNPG